MKIAIIGSREINLDNIDKFIPKDITLLISGGAKGVDSLAEKFADKFGVQKLIFKPDYKKYKNKAPLMRNKLIIDSADLIIAIWNGVSGGTKHAIDYAVSKGKRVRLHIIDVTGAEITPANNGNDCSGNGNNGFECCCDECNYLKCCITKAQNCDDCSVLYCPKNPSLCKGS